MTTETYKGWLSLGGEWNELLLDMEPLAELVGDSEFEGYKVYLRWFVSDKELASAEAAAELQQHKLMGTLEAEGFVIFGSEWTGAYGYQETLEVGGHDLHEELSNYVGKYCLIEITKESPEDES